MYRSLVTPFASFALLTCCLAAVAAESGQAAKETFAHPPSAYSTAPLWVWNDMLTEEQVVGTLRDLAAQKVMQAFVHPRPGLMTPYLSEDWFRLWKAALDEAGRQNMLLWIYDENSYPSGFAGGFVPDAMPESRARGVTLKVEKKAPAADDDLLAVFRMAGQRYENVTAEVRAGKKLAAAEYLVARREWAATSPRFAGKTFVDLLRPGVTQKFLDVTLEPYRQRFAEQFGKRIPGSFTDEPHLWVVPHGVPWTDDLPAAFRKRWDYDLVDQLPCLARNVGDWKRVRHDLLAVLSELFIERWAKPYSEYCEKHKLEFTGHYWDHTWPRCDSVPDNMAMYAWHQRPAIDCLMNQYTEEVSKQFGNARMVKELSSVANQLGRERTLCEAYGAGGWDLRFEDMKRIGDWLLVLGVNTIDEHLSYITLRGARKHDHPQSFSYHEPWWNDYHVIAEYLTRLSYAMTLGKQVNRILVIEPTTTAWMYQFQGNAEQAQRLKQLGDRFFDTVMSLERAQVEYDLGCEDILARHGRCAKSASGAARLEVGQAAYTTVILPPLTENLDTPTVDLLQKFLDAGGRVISCGPPPALVDGRASDRLAALSKGRGWEQVEQLPLAGMQGLSGGGFSIQRQPPADGKEDGILFHHRRQWEGGQLVLLVNTSITRPVAGAIRAAAAGVEQWDLNTGKTAAQPFSKEGGDAVVKFTLPPCGSLLVNFTPEACVAPAVAPERVTTIAPTGPTAVRRIEPNVLTLDYVDVAADGETKKDVYYYSAGNFVFSQHGMKVNPWSNGAVQFRDELIRQKFPPESGFEVSYRFSIETAIPKGLTAVVERPDLYTITCNGRPVAAKPGQWWLDRTFGKIDIATVAKVGENVMTLKAAPMTIYHEIAAAYVLGEFALRPAEKGFVIVPGGAPDVDRKGWNEQGHPFYATGVAYTETFAVPKPDGRYTVALPAWYGSVARVTVNGEPAGHIFHQPWECDVTPHIRPGSNEVEVVIVGTLKNTLGPHHGNPPLGTAWPASFQKAPAIGPPPGKEYHTISYGLYEPFMLKQTTSR